MMVPAGPPRQKTSQADGGAVLCVSQRGFTQNAVSTDISGGILITPFKFLLVGSLKSETFEKLLGC